jgi:DNA-3-methyladenine glycosylase I
MENRKNEIKRCDWCLGNELYVSYHDLEWGVPVHDERLHFEFLTLESAQAGLSWLTILKKRENYRKAYDNFEPAKVAAYGEKKILALLADAGIVRNRQKIEASINNAKRFLEVQKEFGTFDSYIWSFTKGKAPITRARTIRELPSKSKLSDLVSADMKKRGFKFFGTLIAYAHMQATGILNDHIVGCFRRKEVAKDEGRAGKGEKAV